MPSERTGALSSADAPSRPEHGVRPDQADDQTLVTPAVPAEDRPTAPVEPKRAVSDLPRDDRRRGVAPPPRATKVVVKKLDPWSVLKVSLLFYLSVFLILLVAGVLLWAAATSIGVVENIEGFMDSIGFTDFTFEPEQLLRGSALGGAVLVVAGTFGNVVMCVLYNLISEVVGGLKVTLGEDESRRPAV